MIFHMGFSVGSNNFVMSHAYGRGFFMFIVILLSVIRKTLSVIFDKITVIIEHVW